MASQSAPYQSTPQDRTRGLALGIFYVLLAVALAYMLFKIWPPVPWPDPNNDREAISRALTECGYTALAPSPVPSGSPPVDQPKSPAVAMPIKFFNKCVMTSFDERLLLLVIVAGVLGSFVHGATSLADYLGNDCFNRKWTWFYLLRPVIGMALALVFYFVIRGGFLTTNVGATDINPYGIAALAGMVGMFSKQATDKLSEVFSTLFKSGSGEGDEKREDPLAAKATTISLTIDPPEVIAGSYGLKITVTGTDFVEGSTIFLNDSAQPTTFESANQLSAQVAKETIANPSILKLTVINPDLTRSEAMDFRVVAPAGVIPND
jgi:uncharacterized membrane protein YeaQ/YmgE (transglycosylase-associated protein family)